MTILAHKILLQPRPRQAEWLTEQCGFQRWCYNRMLAQFRQGLANGIWWDINALRWDLRRNRPDWTADRWLAGGDIAAQNLDRAIKNWLNPKMDNRFPRFQKRRAAMSCAFYRATIKLDGKRVRLPKLGWVRMRHPLRLDDKRTGNANITFDGRRWWLSIKVDTQTAPAPKTGVRVVGVDVGVKTMAMTSDGVEYANPRLLEESLSELRSVNKAIARSRTTHGRNRNSNRRERLYASRRRIYERIGFMRADAHRQAASSIVKSADVVCVETLNVRGMVKNRRLARAVSDVGLGNLLRELAWQCEKRGVRLIAADQWFPSSKTCSGCGAVKSGLTLSEREYVCGECGLIVGRDRNAALNLKGQGLSLMRGEAVSPAIVGSASVKREVSEKLLVNF